MPQSLAYLQIHLIFSTKARQPFIDQQLSERLHGYMVSVMTQLNCQVEAINSMPDHVHILFNLGRTISVAKLVEEVKKRSTKWVKSNFMPKREFSWQSGYAAFAVSASNLDQVQSYIHNQHEHHKNLTFMEEYLAFLERHNIEFDTRYVFE